MRGKHGFDTRGAQARLQYRFDREETQLEAAILRTSKPFRNRMKDILKGEGV
jgi:hypothetical protein